MQIKVRAFGLLQEALGGSQWKALEIDPGDTVQDLLNILEIDRKAVMNVVKDGMICPWDYILNENDELQLLPPISGG